MKRNTGPSQRDTAMAGDEGTHWAQAAATERLNDKMVDLVICREEIIVGREVCTERAAGRERDGFGPANNS